MTPDASGLIHVDRLLGGLWVRLCTNRRELNGVSMYQAFVAWPGPLGSRDMIRAVSCSRPEGDPLGYEHPAVAICVLGPGSAGPVPARRCIASLAGLAEALAAPGAVACFARGNPLSPPTEDDRAPAWLLMQSYQPRDLTPTHGLPWVPVPAPTAVGCAAAGAQITAVPLPLRALAVAALSSPDCLPHLPRRQRRRGLRASGRGGAVNLPHLLGAPAGARRFPRVGPRWPAAAPPPGGGGRPREGRSGERHRSRPFRRRSACTGRGRRLSPRRLGAGVGRPPR